MSDSPRCLFDSDIKSFLEIDQEAILGRLSGRFHGSLQTTQIDAWAGEIDILQYSLIPWKYSNGKIIFEYDIPRLGKRIDVVLLLNGIIFCIEFKVGELEKQNNELVANKTTQEQTLKTREVNFKALTDMEENLEEAKKKKAIWVELQNKIGKKSDGSDFQEFVQGHIFSSLLVLSDGYLKEMTGGRLGFVQKEQSVDFLIHDKYFEGEKDDDRPVSTLSGGQKFIVSLSLALGIADIARKGSNINFLFLDEGFGSLSGKNLEDATSALLKLRDTGKMLGVITHVDYVISKFPQKIEVVEVADGVSKLVGSGIRHTR